MTRKQATRSGNAEYLALLEAIATGYFGDDCDQCRWIREQIAKREPSE